MFNQFKSVLGNHKDIEIMEKDMIAEYLKVDREALKKFEEKYQCFAMGEQLSDNLFDINSRQASENVRAIDMENLAQVTDVDIEDMENRIVQELLSLTTSYVYDGKRSYILKETGLPEDFNCVTPEEVKKLPENLRPYLTGRYTRKDIAKDTYPELFYFYSEYLKEKSPKKKKFLYDHFRQGLDILDLDSITYDMIGMNPNSMGHWLPVLVEACMEQDFFKIPATRIVKVPITLLQLTRQDYMCLTQTTLNIVDKWAFKAFNLDEKKEYFIKTGTYSSKFDFRNAYVHGKKEVRELGEYLLYIHFQALQMASPLSKPIIYGVSTTNEWVVREFIHDKEDNPCIYKGLPLHTEYRVFVDCDTDKVIGISPYWEPNTMRRRFSQMEDKDSPHQKHDYITFRINEEKLINRYLANKETVIKNIEKILPGLNLTGQWSIDVMQNGDDFWLIDMAVAENSALYECVPKELRNPKEENWIPKMTD